MHERKGGSEGGATGEWVKRGHERSNLLRSTFFSSFLTRDFHSLLHSTEPSSLLCGIEKHTYLSISLPWENADGARMRGEKKMTCEDFTRAPRAAWRQLPGADKGYARLRRTFLDRVSDALVAGGGDGGSLSRGTKTTAHERVGCDGNFQRVVTRAARPV